MAINSYSSSGVPELHTTDEVTAAGDEAVLQQHWKLRMREIQGAIITASLFEAVVGFTGLIGIVIRVIGPLTVATVISLVGLALFPVGAHYCQHNWWIAFLTMGLIALFSRYLHNYDIPVPTRVDGKWRRTGFPLLRLFPVILAIALAWIVCAILTATDVIPDDSQHWAYQTRTDTKTYVLEAAQWFRVPYPFQWGMPTFSLAGFFSMSTCILVSVVESVGDYYACARVAGAPPPPTSAINRGIFIEGIGCIVSGVFGTGTGLTSFCENIGAISITRVGSRRVMIVGSLVMMIVGVFGKFGAIFVAIPEPVVGGVFVTIFGVITAIGVSNLQFVDMNSPRNVFIFGMSIMLGMSLPSWMQEHPNAINTGVVTLDQVLTVLCMTNMFVGGTVAMFLDNTIPGTDEERGVKVWTGIHVDATSRHDNGDATMTSLTPPRSTYDLPFIMSALRRWTWTKYVPISPTFAGFRSTRRCRVTRCRRRSVTSLVVDNNDIEQSSMIK